MSDWKVVVKNNAEKWKGKKKKGGMGKDVGMERKKETSSFFFGPWDETYGPCRQKAKKLAYHRSGALTLGKMDGELRPASGTGPG